MLSWSPFGYRWLRQDAHAATSGVTPLWSGGGLTLLCQRRLSASVTSACSGVVTLQPAVCDLWRHAHCWGAMGGEREEELYERLQGLAPACGSCLEPLVHGFVDDTNFRVEIQDFVAARAQAFLVLCEDGSHPLVWTQYHAEYKELFGRKLTQILGTLEMSGQDLVDVLALLQQDRRNGFLDDDGVGAFLEAVTASEEYENFLAVMFAEVGRQSGEEIDVMVPEGLGPGYPFSVSYLGIQYDLVVPEGFGAGDAFRVAVTRPANLSVASMFNLPDSFYGLD